MVSKDVRLMCKHSQDSLCATLGESAHWNQFGAVSWKDFWQLQNALWNRLREVQLLQGRLAGGSDRYGAVCHVKLHYVVLFI